jgi:hypothetical protein
MPPEYLFSAYIFQNTSRRKKMPLPSGPHAHGSHKAVTLAMTSCKIRLALPALQELRWEEVYSD